MKKRGVRDIYNSIIRDLPPMDRLRLAALIINHLSSPAPDDNPHIDEIETSDLAKYLIQHAGRWIPMEDDDLD